jgi:hypothetical protein
MRMPKQWKCARCATKNPETTLTCGVCRMIRGAVVVPATFATLPIAPVAQIPDKRFVAQGAWPLAPTGSEWAAHADRGRLRGPFRGGAVILVIFLIAVGVTIYFQADRSPTGEITDAGNLGVTSLLVGDCFDLKQPSEEFAEVTARPCSDPHQYELFWIGSVADGPYPDDATFEDFFYDDCVDRFRHYVGTAWGDNRLDIYWLVPTRDSWAAGDRDVQCSVFDPRNPRLTYSLRGWVQPEHEALPL